MGFEDWWFDRWPNFPINSRSDLLACGGGRVTPACACTGTLPVTGPQAASLFATMNKLQNFRNLVGQPLNVNRLFSCRDWNAGDEERWPGRGWRGSRFSQHTRAEAVDVHLIGLRPELLSQPLLASIDPEPIVHGAKYKVFDLTEDGALTIHSAVFLALKLANFKKARIYPDRGFAHLATFGSEDGDVVQGDLPPWAEVAEELLS